MNFNKNNVHHPTTWLQWENHNPCMESPNTPPPPVEDEINPVQAKMSKLSARSSFASFFCKTKRPPTKSDPFEIKAEIDCGSVGTDKDEESVDGEISFKKEKIIKTDPATSEVIAISDTTISDSDFQLISVKPPTAINLTKDDDVISISSEDSEEQPAVQVLRGPVPIVGQAVVRRPIGFKVPDAIDFSRNSPIIKFTDFSEMRKVSFTPPPIVKASTVVKDKEPEKPSTIKSVSASTSTTSDSSSISSYLDNHFADLDPSLREEMMARLSKKSKSSVEEVKPTITVPDTLNKCTSTTTSATTSIATSTANHPCTNTASSTQPPQPSITNDSIVTFKVIQRLNPGTFDAIKSPYGQLLPTTNFVVYWKSSDTFGALKQRIAAILKTSPFELVLAHGQDHMELFDATRPSTIKLTGLNLQEYAITQNKQQSETTTTTPVKPTKTPRKKPTKAQQTTALTSALQGLHSVPPVTIYLYTKSSYDHFNTLQLKKRRQVYDSLSFLQTAEEEISKLSQGDILITDNDLSFELESNNAHSSADAEINLNVKTSTNKNQSYNIKVPLSAKVSDILTVFTTKHQTSGTRVIFDGEVLKNDLLISGLLEDDDMIEIK